MKRLLSLSLLSLTTLALSCSFASGNKDLATECALVCAQVELCEATPPAITLEGIAGGSSGSSGVDCAANCVQEDMRAYYGYSDCQISCLQEAECGDMNGCWDVKSDIYAEYCLDGRETTPVGPGDDDPRPGNGTDTGNADADDIVDNVAVEAAVEDGDFVVNYGDTPPDIVGYYHATGQIDESSNARPVGSTIDTHLCFWDPAPSADGTMINYCEDGVPGDDRAPITGSGDNFTIYLQYDGQATILFSGTVDADGNPTNVEALVVYLSGIDIWEMSHTDWEHQGVCDSCQ